MDENENGNGEVQVDEVDDEFADATKLIMDRRGAVGLVNMFLCPDEDGKFSVVTQCVARDDYTLQMVVTINDALQEALATLNCVAESPD